MLPRGCKGCALYPAPASPAGGPCVSIAAMLRLGAIALPVLILTMATPAAAQPGRQLFQRECAGCHGPGGEGGRGPTLATPKLLRAPDLTALLQIIDDGVPGTEMPGARLQRGRGRARWPLWVAEARAAPGRTPARRPRPRPGDLRGQGRLRRLPQPSPATAAPPAPISATWACSRGAAHLRASLIDPDADIPASTSGYRSDVPISTNFLQVRAVLADGRELLGRAGERGHVLDPDPRRHQPGALAVEGRLEAAGQGVGAIAHALVQGSADPAPSWTTWWPTWRRCGAGIDRPRRPAVAGADRRRARRHRRSRAHHARTPGARPAEPHNWLTYSGNYDGHRHSPLAQIHAGQRRPPAARLGLPGARGRQGRDLAHRHRRRPLHHRDAAHRDRAGRPHRAPAVELSPPAQHPRAHLLRRREPRPGGAGRRPVPGHPGRPPGRPRPAHRQEALGRHRRRLQAPGTR